MNNFGYKIKTLRKKLNLNQEELADRLGVSFQAVSKWETSAAYPDISMFPVLANFFDVTTDELLGVDLSKKKERVDFIISEFNRLSNQGKEKERFDYISNAHKEYPNEYIILEKYIWMLCYDPNCEGNGLLKHEEELLTLCNRILDECSEDKIRYTALSILGGLYREKGDINKALECAKRFPGWLDTSGEEIEEIYENGSEKWWDSVRANIYELTRILMVKIRNCALCAPLQPEGKINLFEKAIDLLKLIYDEGDYGFSHYDLCELYIWIANRYIEMKDYQNAEKYLDIGLGHGKIYDKLPPVTVHTSFLVKDYQFETAAVYSGFEGNEVKRELDYIDENQFYNQVRDMKWFKNIVEKYRQYAKNHK